MAPINKIRELREQAKLKQEKKKQEELLEKLDEEIDEDGLTFKQLKRLNPLTGGRNGKGKYYSRWYETGSRYMGEWLEESNWEKRKCKWTNWHRTPHGLGKFYIENKDNTMYSNEDNEHLQYIGEWANGLYHGQGIYYWYKGEQAGNWYHGSFHRGKKHGFGLYYDKKEKQTIECIYLNDRKICKWSDLYEGRRIQVRFTSYSSVGTHWYDGTIVKYDPERNEGIDGVNNNNNNGKVIDELAIRKKGPQHLIQFDNDKAGYRTRWIDLTQTEFKLIKHSKTSFYKLETFLPELTTPYLSCQTDPLHNRSKRFKQRAIKYYYTNPTPMYMRNQLNHEDHDIEDGQLYDSDLMWGGRRNDDENEEDSDVCDDDNNNNNLITIEERIPLVDTIVKRLDHVYNKMKLLQDEDEEQSLVVVASP